MNEVEDTNTVDIDDTNLDDFEGEFYETAKAEVVEEPEAKEDVVDENGDDSPAPDEDDAEDEEQEDADEDSEEEEEVEEVPQIKKRNKTQERIEKLVAEARQAQREAEAANQRIAALEAKLNEEKAEPSKTPAPLAAEAPKHDAVDENGDPVYELGEFDPLFIRDLTKFTIAEETRIAKEQAEASAAQAQREAAEKEITDKWFANIEKAEESIPEIRESLQTMTQTFQDIEPAYGEYLASAIMQSDVGPQIMHHLSQNIDEAQRIVASGPVAATLALGRLEAMFTHSSDPEEKRNTKQVSKAAPPPDNVERARGRGGRFTVAPDTDDLEAFERVFNQR